MDFKLLYLIDKLHTPILDKIMVFITNLGDAAIIWLILSVVFLSFKKTRKCGIMIIIALTCGFILGNGILKNLVARSRPCWIDPGIKLLIMNPTDYSFPSGHTLASFEAAMMIFMYNKKYGIPAFILASLIAFSRLYLFVHFPSDVIVGAILGVVISLIVHNIIENIVIPKYKNKIKKS